MTSDKLEPVKGATPSGVFFDEFASFLVQTSTGSEAEAKPTECDHYGVDSGGTDYYGTSNPPQEADWNFAFCPKCGVKL